MVMAYVYGTNLLQILSFLAKNIDAFSFFFETACQTPLFLSSALNSEHFWHRKVHLEDIPKTELQSGLPQSTCKLLYCASFQGGCLIKEFAYGKNKDRYCRNR